jgi:hypothetical protein
MKPRFAGAVAAGLLVAYALFVSLSPIWDTDVWWHMLAGRYIATHHALPRTDVLSCLPDALPWRAMTWLFELGAWGVDRAAGLGGVRAATAVLVAAAVVAWLVFFRRQTRNLPAAIALSALFIVLYDDRIRPRPHLINTIAEGLLAWFCLGGARLGRARDRVVFFALFALWANLHNPASVLGCALLVGQLVWRWLVARAGGERPTRDALWAPLLAAAALVCTPYGLGMFAEARKNANATTPVVDEFSPVMTYLLRPGGVHHVLCGTLPYLALFAVGGVAVALVLRRRLREPDVLAWLGGGGAPLFFLAQSLTSMRFVYLCVAPIAWLLAQPRRRSLPAWTAWAVAGALLVVSFDYAIVRSHGGLGRYVAALPEAVEEGRFPEQSARFVAETDVQACILSTAGWGGYVQWFGQRPGIAVDARFNVTPARLAAVVALEMSCGTDAGPVAAALDEYGVDFAVLPAGCFPFDEPPPQWLGLGGDLVGDAFVRRGSAEAARLTQRLGVSADQVAEAARGWNQRAFLAAHEAHMGALAGKQDEASVHELAALEHAAGRDAQAMALLADHLRAVPNCMRAALELVRLLHAKGEYGRALQLLAPAAQLEAAPRPIGEWLLHLRQHVEHGAK